MAIIGAGQLQSPMGAGAVTNYTAGILMEAGANLSKEIETTNAKLDAQVKAPVISKMYAEALTGIAKGDFEAFKGVTQATAMAAGNPFLMAAFKDFDTAAVRLADSHLDRETATARATQAETLQTARIDAQNTRQDKQIDAVNQRQQNQFDVHRQDEEDRIYRQSMTDYERDKAALDSAYQKEVVRVQKANEGESEMAKLDPNYAPNLQQAPPKPQYPQAPVRRTVGSAAPLPSSPSGLPAPEGELAPGYLFPPDAVPGPIPSEPSPMAPAQVAPPVVTPDKTVGGGDLATFGEDEQTIPANTQMGPPLPPAVKKIADEATVVNEKPPVKGVAQRQIGNIVFEIPGVKESSGENTKVSRTIPLAAGQATITTESKPTPANEMAESIATIQGQDPAFALFLAKHTMAGNSVAIQEQTDGKGKVTGYQPVAVAKNGSQVPMSNYNPDGSENGQPHTVSEGVAKSLNKFKTLVEGPMKGKFGFYVALDDKGKANARANAIKNVRNGDTTLEQENKQLALARIKPLTKEETEKAKEEKKKEEAEDDNFTRNVMPYIKGGARPGAALSAF